MIWDMIMWAMQSHPHCFRSVRIFFQRGQTSGRISGFGDNLSVLEKVSGRSDKLLSAWEGSDNL